MQWARTRRPKTLRIEITRRLASRVQRIRMFGSGTLDLAWLAAGKVDACVMLANKPWETAAGTLIAREAGALVLDRHGATHTAASTSTVVVVPTLRDQLIPLLTDDESAGGVSSTQPA